MLDLINEFYREYQYKQAANMLSLCRITKTIASVSRGPKPRQELLILGDYQHEPAFHKSDDRQDNPSESGNPAHFNMGMNHLT